MSHGVGAGGLLLYNSSEFSRMIKLTLILPDAAVTSQYYWYPSCLVQMSLPSRPVWEYNMNSGVPEGRISPRKVAEEPLYVGACHLLPFVNFRCFMFAALSLD